MSAVTGSRLDQLLALVGEARQEYLTEYRAEYERLRAARDEAERGRQRREMDRLEADLEPEDRDRAVESDVTLRSAAHVDDDHLPEEAEAGGWGAARWQGPVPSRYWG